MYSQLTPQVLAEKTNSIKLSAAKTRVHVIILDPQVPKATPGVIKKFDHFVVGIFIYSLNEIINSKFYVKNDPERVKQFNSHGWQPMVLIKKRSPTTLTGSNLKELQALNSFTEGTAIGKPPHS